MFEESLAKYWKELNIDPEGVGPLLIAWKLNASTPGEFKRNEFLKGWSAMGIYSEEKMKAKAKELIKSLKNRETFKEFYQWLFNFAKENQDLKTIDAEVAVDMWNTVMKDQWPLTSQWCRFIQGEVEKAKKKKEGMKAVSRDVWDQCLEFSWEVNPDLSNWDEGGAFPAIIDEFVDFVNIGGAGSQNGKDNKKQNDDD